MCPGRPACRSGRQRQLGGGLDLRLAAPVSRAGTHDLGARCDWAESSEAMRRYHDEEWGVPSWDDRHLFEMLVLEGAQAGLSWSTILNKREGYRRAFDGFDPRRVARYGEAKIASLLADPRHRAQSAEGARRR